GGSGGFAMSLAEAQQLTGHAGQISMIAISNHGGVKNGVSNTDAVVNALDSALANQPYRAVAIKKSAVDTAELAGNAFTSIFLVLGLFSIAAGVLLIF